MLTLKKSLGQHFLKDERVLKRIVQALQERPVGRLLEIGPGGGALTRHLLSLPQVDLRCIEVDAEKVHFLLETWPALRGRILQEDVLQAAPPFNEAFTVVGNFPYNISTQIVFKLLEWRELLEAVVGMFQKEVALRIAAAEGSKIYGVSSVLVQAFFSVEYLFEVEAEAFTPPPKVKSAVIRMVPRAEPVPMYSTKAFTTLVKAAFNQRRKTLRNAVKPLFEPAVLADPLFSRRAEELSVETFGDLSFRMKGNERRAEQMEHPIEGRR